MAVAPLPTVIAAAPAAASAPILPVNVIFPAPAELIVRAPKAVFVPIAPPIVVDPAPLTISIARAASPVAVSTVDVKLRAPPPVVNVLVPPDTCTAPVIVIEAGSAASPVGVKAAVVISPPNTIVCAVTATSLISVPIAARVTVPVPAVIVKSVPSFPSPAVPTTAGRVTAPLVVAKVTSFKSASVIPPVEKVIELVEPVFVIVGSDPVNVKASAPPPLFTKTLPPNAYALAPPALKTISPLFALPAVKVVVPAVPPPLPTPGTVNPIVPALALIDKAARA